MNWLYEKSTGNSRQISLFEGMEYQVTDPFAIDFAVQHISLWGNQPDTQFVVGLTVNTAACGAIRGLRTFWRINRPEFVGDKRQ